MLSTVVTISKLDKAHETKYGIRFADILLCKNLAQIITPGVNMVE